MTLHACCGCIDPMDSVELSQVAMPTVIHASCRKCMLAMTAISHSPTDTSRTADALPISVESCMAWASYTCRYTTNLNCTVCRYGEVSAMCNGFKSRSLVRHSTLVYQGRLHNQPVAVRLHPSARHQSPAVFQHWLDGLSQLSHPHVLPILGACLQPAAIICPLMQVCCSCMANCIGARATSLQT